MAKLIVELESEGRLPETFEVESTREALLGAVQSRLGTSSGIYLFERDQDEEVESLGGRSAIAVIAHRCKRVEVTVQFEHRSLSKSFPPSATVFRVLSWAIGKKGFELDDTARAKANLMLPGAQEPLARDSVIGRYVTVGTCGLALELTLRDFTNG